MECVIKILRLLKRETDEDHAISQKRLRELMAADEPDAVNCNSKTLYNLLHKLHLYLNLGVYSGNQDDNLLLFSGWDKEDDLSDSDNGGDCKTRMGDLRFNHIFTHKELNSLIYAVKTSSEISQSYANKLINKLKSQSSKYYWCPIEQIRSFHEFAPVNKSGLHKNLEVLQQTIDEEVQVSFSFNTYTRRKTLEKHAKKYIVNPYFIISYAGRFYLIANTPPYLNVSIYRIDLMSDVTVHLNTTGNGVPALPKRRVEGLDRLNDPDDFALRHLYMFYDEPVRTLLWVDNTRYTLVHDWFGDSFKFIKSVDNNRDEIEVECSPNAMANWAMQFSDYIEVKNPPQVRELVVKKINAITKKYTLLDQIDI